MTAYCTQFHVPSSSIDFTELMEERLAHHPPEDSRESPALVNTAVSEPAPLSPHIVINFANRVTGVDEVVKNALEDAKTGHMADVSGHSASHSG